MLAKFFKSKLLWTMALAHPAHPGRLAPSLAHTAFLDHQEELARMESVGEWVNLASMAPVSWANRATEGKGVRLGKKESWVKRVTKVRMDLLVLEA